jgi:hypothetical protein
MLLFLLRRAFRHWQVLSILVLGVLLATALLASGPMLVETVMDFALPYKLRSAEPLSSSLRLTTYVNLDEAGNQAIDGPIRGALSNRFGNLIESIIGTAGSNWMYPWVEDQLLADERVNLRFYAGIENKASFLSGGWPTGPVYRNRTASVVVGEALAQAYGLQPGDILPLSTKLDEQEPSVWLEVSGIIRPLDSRDPYWFGPFNPLLAQSNQRYAAQFSAILPQEAFFAIVQALFPNARSELNWHVQLDPGQLRSQDLAAVSAGVKALREDLEGFPERILVETNLENFLDRFITQAGIIRLPLYLIVGEVLLLALFFVAMVAALSVRQVEGEFATLSSRGASLRQILRLQAVEAALIAGAAFASGPLLASGLVWALSRVGPLSDIRQADWIVRLPSAAWLAAGLGAVACLSGLLLPAVPALRRSVVAQRRSTGRVEARPWWQRFYLDVFLLVGGLALTWRLSLYGSIAGLVEGTASPSTRLDWLLLLSPLALLVGSTALLLRLFPVLLSFFARLAAAGRGLPAVLALWQTSRDPVHVARLVLLFTLAVSLGILSTGLNATLDRSEGERARYASGSEVRMAFQGFTPPSKVQKAPGVTASSAVWRGEGRLTSRAYEGIPTFNLLAVDPFSFATVTQYRQDFSEQPMGIVLGNLIVDPERLPVSGISLPSQPARLGLWVADPNAGFFHEFDLLQFLEVRGKIQTAEGEIRIVDLENIPGGLGSNPDNPPASSSTRRQTSSTEKASTGGALTGGSWEYFEASLPPLNEESYPLALHSLWFRFQPLETGGETLVSEELAIVVDDFQVTDRSGTVETIEDFEQVSRLWQTNDNRLQSRYTQRSITHSGKASLLVELSATESRRWLVLSPTVTGERFPLPALASQTFLANSGLKEGDELVAQVNSVRILLVIAESLQYFPTLYDSEERGFLVLPRDALLALLNTGSRSPVNINEIWASTETGEDAAALIGSFTNAIQIWDVETERQAIKADPLSLGLRSVIFLGYALTAVLSLAGFATHFYMSVRGREAVYAVLRSLGLSSGQLYSMLVFEQILLVLSGLALGLLMGSLLNRMVLPGLPVSLGDRPPVPPFFPQDDWPAIGRLYLLLTGMFLASLGAATRLLWRGKLHRILRIGEE